MTVKCIDLTRWGPFFDLRLKVSVIQFELNTVPMLTLCTRTHAHEHTGVTSVNKDDPCERERAVPFQPSAAQFKVSSQIPFRECKVCDDIHVSLPETYIFLIKLRDPLSLTLFSHLFDGLLPLRVKWSRLFVLKASWGTEDL